MPYIEFPNYTKTESVSILSLEPPSSLRNTTEKDTADLWARFTGTVYDTLTRTASRTLPTFKHACHSLWPRFTAPISAGTHTAKDFPKLLILARAHFQDERLLDPGIISTRGATGNAATASATLAPPEEKGKLQPNGTASASRTPTKSKSAARPPPDLASLLPNTARLLLLAAYIASHNPAKHDLTVFSTFHHGRRRKNGGLSVGGGSRRGRPAKHRKIARKLLGAHAFVLERMLAIFAAVRREWEAGAGKGEGQLVEDADVGMAIATLASLRLLTRAGGPSAGDPMDRGGKWRVNVGWEIIRALGSSIEVQVEDWLIE